MTVAPQRLWTGTFLVASALVVGAPPTASAECDAVGVARARAAIAEHCVCALRSGHRAYVRCATRHANAIVRDRRCARAMARCTVETACGTRPRGASDRACPGPPSTTTTSTLASSTSSSSTTTTTAPSCDRSGLLAFHDETAFADAVHPSRTASFDLLPVGFYPHTTFELGGVSVELTDAGSAPIFGPGWLGFTTNFLSTGVQDGANNLVLTFPPGTLGAGAKVASVFPVTVVATDFAGCSTTTVFAAETVRFLGFGGGAGVHSIRITSPFAPLHTPIVNVGDLTF